MTSDADPFLGDALADDTDGGPGLTPMIDVVFQLLVFFMLTAQFVQPALELSLPRLEGSTPPSEENLWRIELAADGTVALDGEVLGVLKGNASGAEAASGRAGSATQTGALVARLGRRFASESERPAAALRVDRRADYGQVAALMQRLGEVGIEQLFFIHETPSEHASAPRAHGTHAFP